MQPARRRALPLGSSSSTERSGLPVGRLGRPHGLKGFLGLYSEAENLVYFQPGGVVHAGERTLVVRSIRKADRGYHIAFEGITDREGAEEIRNLDLHVDQRRPLGVGEFWPEDLIGLEVKPAGGVVVGVEHGPSQSRLVVEREGSRYEVPFVEALVPVVSIEERFVEIAEIEGLF